ncbi:MAG: thioredoxin domain-containing protein, partial [Steroidobacter sp.]
ADSEGHEGKFYVWRPEEVVSLLSAGDYDVFARRFGLDREPNFEDTHWHPHAFRSEEDIAGELQLEIAEVDNRLNRARGALLEVRNRRVWPGRDEKVLTSWNGLAIGGMAAAARALARSDLADAACRAVDFIRTTCWRDGRLLATYKDDRARFAAYLDDHAFLLDGLLELMQTRWRSQDLHFAIDLANTLLDHFEDREHGGFYFTADDHEQLMHRSRSFSDEAVPAGTAIAAQALTRLGLLLGETRYLDAAAKTIRAAWPALQHYPHAHTAMLIALDEHLQPPELVIVRGVAAEADSWRDELAKMYSPRRLVFAIPADAASLPTAIAAKKPLAETAAYVCRGMTCSEPVRSLSSLVALTRS